LAHFQSIDAIQLASVEQLHQAPGVGLSLAKQIRAYFHPHDLDDNNVVMAGEDTA
jgi:excinuclease ABC subunit C